MKKKSYTLVVESKSFVDKKTNEKKDYVCLSVVVNGYRIPIKSVYKDDWKSLKVIKADIALNGVDYVQEKR